LSILGTLLYFTRMKLTSSPRIDDSDSASAGPCQRMPQQHRGQRRVECVLDAAAELVAEGGLAAVTMQAIGKRSGTSAGSLYHFFPDRNSVLKALMGRHVEALRERMSAAQSITPAELQRLSIEARVAHFVHPLLDHIAKHRDFLALTHAEGVACDAPRDPELDRVVMEAAERLVVSCDPTVTPARKRASATMLRAAIEGMLGYAVRVDGPAYPALVRELERMLAGYLGAMTTS